MLQTSSYCYFLQRLWYWIRYRGGHGIHSPFAFWLTGRLLQDTKAVFYKEEELLEQIEVHSNAYTFRELRVLQLAWRVGESLPGITDRTIIWTKDKPNPLLLTPMGKWQNKASLMEWHPTSSGSGLQEVETTRNYEHLLLIAAEQITPEEIDHLISQVCCSASPTYIVIILREKPFWKEARQLYRQLADRVTHGQGFTTPECFIWFINPLLKKQQYKQWLK